MNLLLDTNVVVWVLGNPGRLSPNVRDILQDPDNRLIVSAGSLLEMTSKAASGRLVFSDRMRSVLTETCEWLPVSAEHAFLVQTLPTIHKDPFDRLLIAQAMIENLTLVTGDRLLADYGVPTIFT